MPDDDPLKRERYKFVTDRQKYFTGLARDAFISYARFFAAIVAGSIVLVSSRDSLHLSNKLLSYLLDAALYLAAFLAVVASLQIVFCLWRWYGFRTVEKHIDTLYTRSNLGWWIFEALYVIAIWAAFIGAWTVIQKLPGLLPDTTDKLQL